MNQDIISNIDKIFHQQKFKFINTFRIRIDYHVEKHEQND